MNDEAQKIIARLGLAALQTEGEWIRKKSLREERLASGRAAGSAIYFLVTPEDFSALHRMRTDEVWHFYAGDALEHVQLDPRDGAVRVARLGGGLAGEVAQLVAPGGVWQGARLAADATRGWALVGCTMAPAWDEREFELGRRDALGREFPSAREKIEALTR